MTCRLLAAVIALTRWWLGVYTRYAPREIAIARRAEVESDLWEMKNDPDLRSDMRLTVTAMSRLTNGVLDDLAWCFETLALEKQIVIRRMVAFTAASLMVLSLWTLPSLFWNGRREVEKCAATTAHLPADTDLRFELMRCAGAFFSAAR